MAMFRSVDLCMRMRNTFLTVSKLKLTPVIVCSNIATSEYAQKNKISLKLYWFIHSFHETASRCCDSCCIGVTQKRLLKTVSLGLRYAVSVCVCLAVNHGASEVSLTVVFD